MKKKSLLLVVLLAGMCIGTFAQDVITFTHEISKETLKVTVRANEGGLFTVNWGDGSAEELYAGKGDDGEYSSYQTDIVLSNEYDREGTYTVTIKGSNKQSYFTYLYLNASLTTIDVTQAPQLTFLYCWGAYLLTRLDVSRNTKLRYLYCNTNNIEELDCSNNTQLYELECYDNAISRLSLNQSLHKLRCGINQLTELDLTNTKLLTSLDCNNNSLASLDVSSCSNLTFLNVNYNQLVSLDVSHNPMLETLKCPDNKLTTLDVSQHEKLTHLDCNGNSLSLANLYALSQLSNLVYTDFNLQELPSVSVMQDTPVAVDTVFNGIHTIFDVRRGLFVTADEKDYVLTGGYITFTTPGTYSVYVSNPGIQTSSPYPPKVIYRFEVSDAGSGVADLTTAPFRFYPNPTRGVVTLTGADAATVWEVYGVTGNYLFTATGAALDLSHTEPGVYLVRVGGVMVKVVKE